MQKTASINTIRLTVSAKAYMFIVIVYMCTLDTLNHRFHHNATCKNEKFTYHQPAGMYAKPSIAQPTDWAELRTANRKQ